MPTGIDGRLEAALPLDPRRYLCGHQPVSWCNVLFSALDRTWCQMARSKHHQTSCCESIESFRASPLAVMSFIQASETPPSVTPSVELRSLPATCVSGTRRVDGSHRRDATFEDAEAGP